MALKWPERDRDPLATGIAITLALLTTSGIATALAFSLAHTYWIAQPERHRSTVGNREIVAFAVPVVRETRQRAFRPPLSQRSDAPRGPDANFEQVSSVEPTSDALRGERDSSSLPGVRRAAPSPTPGPSTPQGGPLLNPVAFSRAKSFGAAERESLLTANLRRPFVKLNGWRLVSEDEKTGFPGEMDKRFEKARLEHVPADVAARTGGFSINVGWLSSGPSRQQRIRDSSIFQETKERLGRLAVRAQAKRDSVRVADSLRRLKKTDSL